jgi:membrane-associated phospholipid phosphatase
MTALAKGVSFLAGPYVHPAVAAALGILLRAERGRGGYGPGAASVGSLGVDNATRILIHQKRPPKAGPHHSRYRYGFPSGHTTAATAIGIAAGSAIAGDLPRTRQALVWATVAAIALGVGWSRLYLDEHWLDDVVGGWMAGTVIGLGAASLDASLS